MRNKPITIKIVFSRELLEDPHIYYGGCKRSGKNTFTIVVNPDKNKTDRKKIATLFHEFSHFILNTYFNYTPRESAVNEEVGQYKLESLQERICLKIEKSAMKVVNKYFKRVNKKKNSV